MQHLKNFNWKKFLLQGVLPFLLAVAVGFISRYQLELWPRAFCSFNGRSTRRSTR